MKKEKIHSRFSTYLKRFCFISMTLLLTSCKYAVLNPKGMVAATEKDLIILATNLMLIVVIPVIILSLVIAWRYRASNTKAAYTPNWSHSYLLEAIWWTIPIIIITILATITWRSTHSLDPYKPLDVKGKPLVIQAVALDWKWLFIYPEQNIATVNFVEFPAHRPVHFDITADAPMNSFMITQLASQIYAMGGMKTQLNLIADEPGDYRGMSTNFSGEGFSGMRFVARAAASPQAFNDWVNNEKRTHRALSIDAYNELAKPSSYNPVKTYAPVAPGLFNHIIMKFMKPEHAIDESMKDEVKL